MVNNLTSEKQDRCINKETHKTPVHQGFHWWYYDHQSLNNGAAVNILPMFMLKALGKTESDLIPTDVAVCGFAGNTTQTKGILPVEWKVGSLNKCTAFFVIERTSSVKALLGRDWLGIQ